ncbi:MAG: hypothetical protein F4210_00495 [Holophagales bacterium]|nr:hypothetical protein [Holophagales bacterium]MYF93997.1 hypothetical protein [Holophagales bacterium]
MPALEFFVPALAGYLFLRLTNAWKFGLRRESGYHVVFRSTLTGLLLYAMAAATAQWCPYLYSWIDGLPAWSERGISKAAVGSLALAAVASVVVNRFYGPLKARQRLADKKGDLVDVLIFDAFEEGSLIEVAFPTGKTYLGLILRSSTADDGSDTGIQLVPVLSGYRDENQRLRLTTSYARVLRERWHQLAIAIRCSELKWLRRFDTDLYPWDDDEPPRILTVNENTPSLS